MQIVTHYTEIDPALQSPLFVQDYGTVDIPASEMIHMLGRSAQIASPGCKLVLLSDSITHIGVPGFEVKRYDLPETRYRGVNHHRMFARTEFCKTAPDDQYIFCDYDVLINRIPEMDFDMGITIRKIPQKIKVQEGVMYCSNIRCAEDYFSYIYDRINNGLPTEIRDWGGTQDAAFNLLWKIYEKDQQNPVIWKGYRMRLLPYQKYNRTPGPHGLEPEDVFAWHFKGARRKPMMRKYYDRIMKHGQTGIAQGRQEERIRI